MNRTEKQELIDELHGEFKASPHAVLVDFKGLFRARAGVLDPTGCDVSLCCRDSAVGLTPAESNDSPPMRRRDIELNLNSDEG